MRQRTTLILMASRNGYPGVSPYGPDVRWPYLSRPEMLQIMANLEERGLVRRLPDDSYELTKTAMDLLARYKEH